MTNVRDSDLSDTVARASPTFVREYDDYDRGRKKTDDVTAQNPR